jgi:hypothetical protein
MWIYKRDEIRLEYVNFRVNISYLIERSGSFSVPTRCVDNRDQKPPELDHKGS